MSTVLLVRACLVLVLAHYQKQPRLTELGESSFSGFIRRTLLSTARRAHRDLGEV